MVESLNRQRVLNFLDVFYSGDVEGALSRCSDDIEFFSNAPVDLLPHMGHHRGKAELREMCRTVHTRYYDMRHEVRAIVAEGDKVAVDLRLFFKKSLNNRIVQFDLAAFYTLRDGRITPYPRDHRHLRPRAAGAGARSGRGDRRHEAGRQIIWQPAPRRER